jgi:DNA (cytosine-5)-methyltransferase 1
MEETLNELHLFAGAGGGILGGMLLGHTCVCAVEINPYCREVLLQRQRDGLLPRFPIWDDVRTFDGRPWNGIADIVCGGFPCQDISAAGKGDGLEGARSGLWAEMRRVAGEVRPRYIFVENSPMLTTRGMGVVLGDLAALGYDAQWGVLGAHHAGAPHLRDRMWILADNECDHDRRANGTRWGKREQGQAQTNGVRENGNWLAEPNVERVANGVAYAVDKHRTARLRCLGNGQVPAVARLAWEVLSA